MIQTTIIPNDRIVNLSFTVPDNYIGQEMEVIAFMRNEGMQLKEKPKSFLSFDAIKIDTTEFKFNRDDANER